MDSIRARKTFYQLLANTLVAATVDSTVWFAITFFLYLKTQSVLATAILAGLYLVLTALSGFWFGSIVDHHKKKHVMVFSSICSLAVYILCFILYITAGEAAFSNPANPILWLFILLLMMGVIIGNIRTIALPTLVTLLIEEGKRDKANGLVGTTVGVSFLVTSVISGVLVGLAGMLYVLILAIAVHALVLIYLKFLRVDEKLTIHEDHKKIDIRGTLKLIFSIPGLFALILFTTLNNFLGGAFMSLMDAYGLSLVSVQVWGFLWGLLSTGFIVGGLLIAKRGLGKNPLRTLMITNIVLWSVASVFTLQASIILLVGGMYIYMCLMPHAEAAEHTILQKVVPYERQGRVFGFAQSMEQAASPLTAFLIGPLTQFIFIPFMSEGGAGANLIGGWFGTGQDRGIALVFTVTGLIGLAVTLLAMGSKYYRQLSERYLQDEPATKPAVKSS